MSGDSAYTHTSKKSSNYELKIDLIFSENGVMELMRICRWELQKKRRRQGHAVLAL